MCIEDTKVVGFVGIDTLVDNMSVDDMTVDIMKWHPFYKMLEGLPESKKIEILKYSKRFYLS